MSLQQTFNCSKAAKVLCLLSVLSFGALTPCRNWHNYRNYEILTCKKHSRPRRARNYNLYTGNFWETYLYHMTSVPTDRRRFIYVMCCHLEITVIMTWCECMVWILSVLFRFEEMVLYQFISVNLNWPHLTGSWIGIGMTGKGIN